ncbi:efflux RND transporter periplasmic adaptor subunit [Spirosoma flavum]|uniref:Efflux RND transporter periplasmic adaptor subunit n=1 Tax=Spirosoma flavum TaxID=2048557 RepID=A0ABW6AHQ2_9BACT
MSRQLYFFGLIGLLLLTGCGSSSTTGTAGTQTATADAPRPKTPVEVTTIKDDSFREEKTFRGLTYYLTSGDIKSPIAGYVTKVYVKIGDQLRKGAPLFGLETKEAYALGGKNYLNDPTLKNIGQLIIRAPDTGLITLVQAEENEYVQDGTVLASFSAPDMFVFLIEVPVEQDSSVHVGSVCRIQLPNGRRIAGRISRTLAMADSLSQTERFVVKPDRPMVLPARLQLNITFTNQQHNNAQSLPKEAVLANELQTDFWVMKLVNDTTAIKVPVKIGLQRETRIEILSPRFAPKDRFVSKGGYGLADTSSITINRPANAH